MPEDMVAVRSSTTERPCRIHVSTMRHPLERPRAPRWSCRFRQRSAYAGSLPDEAEARPGTGSPNGIVILKHNEVISLLPQPTPDLVFNLSQRIGPTRRNHTYIGDVPQPWADISRANTRLDRAPEIDLASGIDRCLSTLSFFQEGQRRMSFNIELIDFDCPDEASR